MVEFENQYQEFRSLPFPEELSGEKINGIDLIMLDADTAGLLQKYIRYKRKFSKSDIDLLVHLNGELK